MMLGRYFQTKHQMKCIIDISHMKLASADLVLIEFVVTLDIK